MGIKRELPLCSCGEFYQSHHPECPARRAYEDLLARWQRTEGAADLMARHDKALPAPDHDEQEDL